MSGNRSWCTSSSIGPSVLSGEGERGRGRGRRVSSDPDVVEVITKDLIRKIKCVCVCVCVCVYVCTYICVW